MAVREIGTDIKLTGEKEFNDGMKSINSNLKTLRSDMAAVSATFEDNANSVEALTAKNKILQDSVDQQRVKVDALRQMYEKVAAASGENSAAADKWKQQLNNATVALAKEERALRQNSEALEAAKKAADSAEDAVEDLADANADVARTADRAADELDDMADKAEKTGSILPAVAQGFGSVATGAAQATAAVLAVGAGLGTAAITALVSFAKESAEAAKAAQEAGETLDESQTAWLAYADKLDSLEASAAKAKSALGGVLLPQLSKLSTDGSNFLSSFARSMEAAGGDSEKQAKVISEYVASGATLLTTYIPEYIKIGKDLLGGLKEGIEEAAPEIWDAAGPLVQEFLAGIVSKGPDVVESAVGIVEMLASGLSENADTIIPKAGELITSVVDGIADSLPELGTAAGKIVGELALWLTDPDTIETVLNAAVILGEALANAIWEALKGAFLGMVNLTELIGPISGDMDLALSSGSFQPAVIPGHANGLDRVPFDNYLARLHKDEMVLTASEAARYRNGRGQGTGKVGVIENLTIYTQHLDEAEMERILDTINRKLGDDM